MNQWKLSNLKLKKNFVKKKICNKRHELTIQSI